MKLSEALGFFSKLPEYRFDPSAEFPILWAALESAPEPKSFEVPNSVAGSIFVRTNDFKKVVEKIFGQASPALVKLYAQKMVGRYETGEYEVDFPSLGVVDRVKEKIRSKNDAQMAKFLEGKLHVSRECLSIESLCKKIYESRLDFSLVHKGFLAQAAGITNPDYLQTIVRNHQPCDLGLPRQPAGPSHVENPSSLFATEGAFMRNFTEAQRVKMLCDPQVGTYELQDSVRQYEQYKNKGLVLPTRFKNLKDLHDQISHLANEIQAKLDNQPLEYSEAAQKLQDMTGTANVDKLDGQVGVDTVRFVLPKDSATMALWGRLHHHCVGSYGTRVQAKDCLIVAVLVNGEHKYTMELREEDKFSDAGAKERNFYIVQLQAPFNKPADIVHKTVVQGMLVRFYKENPQGVGLNTRDDVTLRQVHALQRALERAR